MNIPRTLAIAVVLLATPFYVFTPCFLVAQVPRPPAEEAQRVAIDLLTALNIKTETPPLCTAKPIDLTQAVHVFVCNVVVGAGGSILSRPLLLTVYCDAGVPTMACWIPPRGGFDATP